MKRLAWLGILATLGVLVYLGSTKRLPDPLQRQANKVESWAEHLGIGKAVQDLRSNLGFPGGPGADDHAGSGVKPAPRKVLLPEGSFIPLALALESKRTHLIYLEDGQARSAVFKGLIVWEEDTGTSRIYVEKQPAPVTGPNGEKLQTRRKSYIEQLRRFEYGSGEVVDLHPKEIKGIVLEAEDLLYPGEYKSFFLEENREVLAWFGGEVILGVHRALFLGGAHAVEAVHTERIELENGAALARRFEPERTSVVAAEAARGKSKGGCTREHEGSVALRGPGGAPVPAAVLGATYESCRGKLSYFMEPTELSNLRRKGIPLGFGASFRRGRVYAGETPILKGVSDVIPLKNIRATVAVLGDRFAAPAPNASPVKGRLVFKAFDRSSKSVSLGRAKALIGSVAFDLHRLDDRDLQYLKQIFNVGTAK